MRSKPILKNGIVTYHEIVLDDYEKVTILKKQIREAMNPKVGKPETVQVNDLRKQLAFEMTKKRKIEYEISIDRIKTNCVCCGKELGKTLEALIDNNIVRGNYCGTCNNMYGGDL